MDQVGRVLGRGWCVVGRSSWLRSTVATGVTEPPSMTVGRGGRGSPRHLRRCYSSRHNLPAGAAAAAAAVAAAAVPPPQSPSSACHAKLLHSHRDSSPPSQVHPVHRPSDLPTHNDNQDTGHQASWRRESICISVDCEDPLSPVNVEDQLFDMFKDEQEDKVHMGRFIAALTETGLRRTDPRLKEMRDNLAEVHAMLEDHEATSVTALNLDRTNFVRVIRENIVLISKALRHQLVIPEWHDFCSHIDEFYWNAKNLPDGKCPSEDQKGKVASYIPQLARFSPDHWGVSVCTIDGQRYSVGDTNMNFTMQSCSKPLTYAIALNELGADTVHKYVGQEPSGRMFNAIVLDYNDKPHNPLVNAGAIVVNSLLTTLIKPGRTTSDKFDYVQQYFQKMAGNEYVGFSNGTFLSERENADRNYSLGYFMREMKVFPEKCDLMGSLDHYFQTCALEVTCESMSVMAATLANGGICPITGDQVIQPFAVRDVLSLMHSCGMYDYSGQFAFKVGLPAKSGVAGAIMLVIPNVMGICTWSPPLDSLGNSVRGLRFCDELVRVFNFHRYDNLRHAANKKDPRKQKYESKGQKIVNLLFSASAGDVTAMRRYALAGMNMSESDYDGRTAMHLAAADGHLELVQFLLEKCNVDVQPKDRWGHTPEDDANEFGHKAIADYLKEKVQCDEERRKKDFIQEETVPVEQ